MAKKISTERKAAYYIGMGLSAIGFLLFITPFFTMFGSSRRFEEMQSSTQSIFIGFAIIAAGQFIRTIGARGLSGSGIILNTKKARKDLEPYSRMTGGILKDMIEETDIKRPSTEKVIMIRCQHCKTLNEENSKFCQECGKNI